MAGLLGDSFDDPRTGAVLQAAMGLLGGGSNAQRFAGAGNAYFQAMQAERAKKLREDEIRQQMAAREQLMQAQRAQAEEAAAERQKRQGIEQAYRSSIRSPDQQAMSQFGGPTRDAARVAPGMAPQVDQQALISELMKVDPVTAFQMLQPKPRKVARVITGTDEQGNKIERQFDEEGREVGGGVQGYVAPQGVNLGDKFSFLTPRAGTSARMGFAPGELERIGISRQSANAASRQAGAAEDANAIQRQQQARLRELQIDEAEDKAKERGNKREGAVANFEAAVGVIDKALNHPGRETATGLSGQIDPRNYFAGTQAKDFQIVAKQLEGQAFLEAFESLKGGGQITQIEGEKATAAKARLDRAQSDQEYAQALNDLRGIVTGAYKRVTGRDYQKPATPFDSSVGAQPAVKFLGFE